MTSFYAQWSFHHVKWRNLTWAEFRKFHPRYRARQFDEPMDVYNDVYQTVLIDGPVLHAAPAGIVEWIGRQQLTTNPFSGEPGLLLEAQNASRAIVHSSALVYAKAVVAAVLHYKLEEIEQWDPTTFFTRLAMAEAILGKPIVLVPPEPKSKGKKRPGQT